MSITHATATRNAIADAVVDSIDTGGAGKIILSTSGDVDLVTLTCSNPAFGAASGGVATANAITPGTVGTTGTAAKFRVTKNDGTTVVFSGSVGTSGADMIITSTSLVATESVSISAFTYTAPV